MKFIAMDLIHGFRFKQHYKEGAVLSAKPHFLVIRLPNSWIMKLVARSLVLALVIASLPQISSIIGGPSSEAESVSDSLNLDLLPLLLRDLRNEGIVKTDDRALFLGNKNDEGICNSDVIGTKTEFVLFSDTEKQGEVADGTFDFAFTTQGFHVASAAEFVDRVLKVGGVVAVQLSEDPAMAFRKPDNFQIVYLRWFDTTVIGMRKTGGGGLKSPVKRKLFGVTTEAKKAALKKLEDVLLEPPRAASGKSKTYLKRTRYLPDLLGDSLESYPRRVFIDVGLPEKKDGAAVGWFEKHYPRRNKDFELYKIETVMEEFSGKEVQPQIGISDWLRKNVREEEYVVMKAEAEVVEEMVKSRVLGLVDELFLECKYKGLSGKSEKSRRAYWECLALYGRLRDEGVAVHQWWG